jgi:hypothetical protein
MSAVQGTKHVRAILALSYKIGCSVNVGAVGEVEIACKQSTWRVNAEAGALKRLARQP